jgi:hypothetical protein
MNSKRLISACMLRRWMAKVEILGECEMLGSVVMLLTHISVCVAASVCHGDWTPFTLRSML